MNKTMNRRQAISCLSSAAVLPWVGTSAVANSHQSIDNPNIILLLADDLHFRALGCYGNQEIHTPNLDRLSEEGMRFTNCHVSNPICSPSRAALLTGQYGFQNGSTYFNHRTNDDSPKMPALLAQQGYETSFTGKWHNNGRPFSHGFTKIKNTFLGGMNNYDSIAVVNGQHDSPYEIHRNPTEVFTEGALELLQDASNPYLLMYSLTSPHDPRTAPPEYESLYDTRSVSVPENFMSNPVFDPGTLNIRDEKLLRRPLNQNELKREIARYYAMITHLDSQIGLILAYLERSGQIDNTYIVFASDNGLALGAHGLLGKQTMYEEGIRVPLIIKGPGIAAGSECNALTDLMDLAPTFTALSGGKVPDSMNGINLSPYLQQESNVEDREYIYAHYDERDSRDGAIPMFRMVKDKRYKFIQHLNSDRQELFDLENDPLELHDLSSSTDHQNTKELFVAELKRWRQEIGDYTL